MFGVYKYNNRSDDNQKPIWIDWKILIHIKLRSSMSLVGIVWFLHLILQRLVRWSQSNVMCVCMCLCCMCVFAYLPCTIYEQLPFGWKSHLICLFVPIHHTIHRHRWIHHTITDMFMTFPHTIGIVHFIWRQWLQSSSSLFINSSLICKW